MKKILLFQILLGLIIITVNLSAQDKETGSSNISEEQSPSKWKFGLSPNIGFTFLQSSKVNEENENLQWLAKLNSRLEFNGDFFQFLMNVYSEYGQIVKSNEPPEKYHDLFILTITPSISLINHPPIKLFLENNFETNFGNGKIGNRTTTFLDPIFLSQSLFLGQRQLLIDNTENSNSLELTYGLGYATQQTLTKNFKKDTLTAGTETNFETGISAVFRILMNFNINDKFKFKTDINANALSKDNFLNDYSNARSRILIISGLYYSIVGIEYNFNLLYDKNLSKMRQLEQSLVFSFNFDI